MSAQVASRPPWVVPWGLHIQSCAVNPSVRLSRLYTFIKRYVRKTISLADANTPYAMALFSKDGILLDLYAKDSLVLE